MKSLFQLYKRCKENNNSFIGVLLKSSFYRLRGKSILANSKVIIKGLKNIEISTIIRIGMSYVGFMHRHDYTYLNIRGKLEVAGDFSIGKGCRISVGKSGALRLGKNSYINVNSIINAEHFISIGNNCAISWEVQIIDEDFHNIVYAENNKTKEKNKDVIIGDGVWIGCRVSIFKGTIIPNNCIIAGNSVVRGIFEEEGVLIAGNPAKIIKRNVSWK